MAQIYPLQLLIASLAGSCCSETLRSSDHSPTSRIPGVRGVGDGVPQPLPGRKGLQRGLFGFDLEGSVALVEACEHTLGERAVAAAVYLDVPQEVLAQRCAGQALPIQPLDDG